MFLKENKKTQAINIYNVMAMNITDYSFGTDENGNYKNNPSFKFINYVSGGDSQYLSLNPNYAIEISKG
jgi:hypothetical protein